MPNGQELHHRLRSYAANSYVGSQKGTAPSATGRHFSKFSNVSGISTSETWSILDQHEDSIEDAHFANYPRNNYVYAQWVEHPSARHRKSCNLSFLDGHVERHRWLEKSTLWPVRRSLRVEGVPTFGEKRDVQWLTEHATALTE